MSASPHDGSIPRRRSASPRIERVQTPVIPVVADLIRRQPGTISLGQGVVYYGPPAEALKELETGLLEAEIHKYKPVIGIPPLVERLREKVARENGIAMDEQRSLVVTAGGNLAFYNALLATTDAGDEVILQTPYYFNHEMAVVLANCKPVLVPTNSDYHLQIDKIRQAITSKTRAIVTVSPNNPTGAVYPERDLRAVNELCQERGIYHVHDEAYESFVWQDATHVSPGSFAGSAEHTINLFSMSKAYGFASWRIGYMVIPAHLLEAVRKIQDTLLICAPVVSQIAAIGALKAGSDYCKRMVQPLVSNRTRLLDELNRLGEDCVVSKAEGAFYVMLGIRRNWDPLALVERLIQRCGVAVIPGTAFGIDRECSLRIAYGAIETSAAETAFRRLASGLKDLLNEATPNLPPLSNP